MINQLIRQLNSPDPKRRIKAIKALAKTGDRAALGPLLKVYKSDSDAKVRELALKAGRYIKKHAGPPSSSRSGGESSSSDSMEIPAYKDDDTYDDGDTYDDAYSYEEGGTDEDAYDDGGYVWDGDTSHRKSFYADSITDTMMMPALGQTTQHRTQALGMLDEVENLKWRGQKDEAIKVLSKAMQLDPKLWKNSYAVHLIRSVTKMPPDEAYDLLMGDMAALRKKRKKKSRRGPAAFSWRGALIELTVFGVVFALLVLIPGVLALDHLKDSFVSAGDPQSLPITQQQYNKFVEQSAEVTPLFVLVFAVVFGVAGAVALFIQNLVIHIAARFVFSSDGTLIELIRKSTPFYTVAYSLIILVSFARFWPGLVEGEQVLLTLSIAIGMAAMLTFLWSLWLISEVYR